MPEALLSIILVISKYSEQVCTILTQLWQRIIRRTKYSGRPDPLKTFLSMMFVFSDSKNYRVTYFEVKFKVFFQNPNIGRVHKQIVVVVAPRLCVFESFFSSFFTVNKICFSQPTTLLQFLAAGVFMLC